MVTVDLKQDAHRVFLATLEKKQIIPKIVWQKGSTYCLDWNSHNDYSAAKKIQIALDKTHSGIPCV